MSNKKKILLFITFLAIGLTVAGIVQTYIPFTPQKNGEPTEPHMTPLAGNIALIICATIIYTKTCRSTAT